MRTIRRSMALLGPLAVVLAGCGDNGSGSSGQGAGDGPTIVATSTMLGDVVGALVGDQATVETIMPVGASPHDFQASAQQAASMRAADAMVVNGAGFEEGLLDTIEAAASDGVPTFEAVRAIDEPLTFGDEGDHAADAEGSADPHFFTTPARMMAAAEGMADFLASEVPALDTGASRDRADDYISQLGDLDAEVTELLSSIPEERRVMVTNHEALAYFADSYDFKVVGTVIPSGSTSEGASGGELAELAEVIRREEVPAIFAETTAPADLADTVADEVGDDVEVVELHTGSLGEESSDAATYAGYIRTNARRIAGALAEQS